MKKLTLALCIIFLLAACDKKYEEPHEPTRSQSVPMTAFWIGGHDGGVFVLVDKPDDSKPNEYLGEIYYSSGDVAYKGIMFIHPEGAIGFDHKNPDFYEGWDGDTLYIVGDKQLRTKAD